jgi:hypothetical protein
MPRISPNEGVASVSISKADAFVGLPGLADHPMVVATTPVPHQYGRALLRYCAPVNLTGAVR